MCKKVIYRGGRNLDHFFTAISKELVDVGLHAIRYTRTSCMALKGLFTNLSKFHR